MQRILPIVSGAEKTDDVAPTHRHTSRDMFPRTDSAIETTFFPSPMMFATSFQCAERILSPVLVIVDDSETVRKILEVCLHRAGYEEVHLFSDGTTFLRWLMTPEARIPALMFVDLKMPEIDGYTLIRHLKAKPAFARTIFVILTGRDGMLDKFKGRLSGAQAYLTKPFCTDDILATIHTCLSPLPAQHPSERQRAEAYR